MIPGFLSTVRREYGESNVTRMHLSCKSDVSAVVREGDAYYSRTHPPFSLRVPPEPNGTIDKQEEWSS